MKLKQGHLAYKKMPPPRPYSRPTHRAQFLSWGGGRFCMSEVPMHLGNLIVRICRTVLFRKSKNLIAGNKGRKRLRRSEKKRQSARHVR